ncbi:MAG TPA: carboxypeptidase-like regulatory domain-containing protein [Candidatus Angelobacter sp.]
MKALTSTPFLRRSLLLSVVALMFLLVLQSMPAWAQGGSGGTVSGVVTDPQDAVIPGAEVTLTNKETGATQKTNTQADGHYLIVNLPPGIYDLTVVKKGFETSKVTGQQVRVGVTTTSNVKLKVGAENITVEVKSTGNELQTLDASVGNVFDQQALEKLPSLNRDATAILLIQPLAQPGFNGRPGSGETNTTGGGIAGARADQNTFMVDGGDATSNTEGGGGYAQQAASGFAATPRAAIPTPVESLQEMRVVTNNSNTFARSTGGEVQMVTRSGTNAWHGAAYENNQNTDYNANLWQLNKVGKPRGIWIDNRFGGRLGGPILKDKAFFFIMYEGHDFKTGNPLTRDVPSDLMRQGIIQYKDDSGVLHQVNLLSGTGCGAAGTLACDPRGKGLSPVISSIWAKMPHGNNLTEGDGLNAIGFDTSVPVIVRDNFAVAKFDYKLTKDWDLNTSYHYAVSDGVGSGQADIGGLLPGDTLGSAVATRSLPTQPRYLTFGGTGHIGPNLTTEAHFNWLRHWWQWKPVSPFPQVSGTAAAVQIFAENVTAGLVPLNIDTQNARSRTWNGKDFTWGDSTTWIKGKHILSFGGEIRHEHFTHTRDDKVVGALTNPVYFADKTSDIAAFASNFLPPNCASTSCINTWQNAYVATTGMISHASQLLTRGADFSPNAPGTPLHQDTIVDWYNLYFADTWRMTSTLSVTLGLGWGAQTPPFENSGLQTIMIDTTTGKPIIYSDFLTNLASAAAQGKVFAPQLGFASIKSLGMKYPYNPEWNDFEPRLSFAWNPSNFMKGILGDRKTVIRAGYGRFHDRLNGVGLVMTPALGIGFGNTVTCRRVTTTDACGTLGKTDPTNAFRIGVDGSSVPLPALAALTPPLIPGVNSPFEALDFRIDPHRRVGVEDTWDLSIQRQLPGNTLLEIGYVGRMAHHLYTVDDMNQVPYMLVKGGQTFAAAYDAVASALRAGNPVAPQPFWETLLGPGGTASVAAKEKNNFLNGLVTNIFDNQIGLPYLDKQIDNFQTTTSNGNSNYHSAYVSIRKQFSRGLLFQANYTWSHSLDTVGFTQENVFITPSDNFNPHRDYGPSQFDRRHTINLFYVYDLPFGKNHFIGRGNNILDRIIGGWTFSGQFIAASGIPLSVNNGGGGEEFGSGDQSGILSAYLPTSGAPTTSSSHYNSDGSVTAFANPNPNQFTGLLFADQRTGSGALRSFPRWNMDMAISKAIPITERFKLGIGMQAINVFNHMEFNDPTLNIASANFGKTSNQYTSPRFLNLNVRVDF